MNLFVPILESEYADEILKSISACPKNFDHICRDELYRGYCFEFWNSTDDTDKGFGDHSKQAGTDADVAICYSNTQGEKCLWLIEHKLTEAEFTTCGGYRSKRNQGEDKVACETCSLAEIVSRPDICYYHRVSKYKYWHIMSQDASKALFAG
ncbi:MAG: hypothetical protein NC038_02645 [Paludibacter sp.]|nr:hypothetical protein [Bacteroidales bacterium]MCM1068978.1 hypothetical protein [Prevotella sp.]MCM1353641.1 hypothetical protein [Bacteroides sp.]MCM1442010.1 hypothetical protein [Muribaculum sp.]MCM1481534.1 hypothetical protein [Paludibacter sp.]